MIATDACWHHADDGSPCAHLRHAPYAGLFLTWGASRGLLSRDFKADYDAEIQALGERLLTPARFFQLCCDGLLVDEDLNRQGNAFANHYLSLQAPSLPADLRELLGNDAEPAASWAHYDLLEARLDLRFAQWHAGQ